MLMTQYRKHSDLCLGHRKCYHRLAFSDGRESRRSRGLTTENWGREPEACRDGARGAGARAPRIRTKDSALSFLTGTGALPGPLVLWLPGSPLWSRPYVYG